MAFVTKTWKDRLVEYAGRRKIKNVATGEETLVDVSRSEGTVSQAGDAFSAANMNNLEQRIKEEFDTVNSSLESQPIFQYDETGKITGYKTKAGADTVFPFSGIATLLWKNPNLSAPMNAQTISGFGGENYKQLLIQTNHRTVAGLQTTSCWLWFPSKGISLWAGSENGVTDNARTFTWNNDGSVSINVDYFSGAYQPQYVIPAKIYGLKSEIKLQDN